jgi:hypothetical protein
MKNTLYSCHILMKFEFSRHILEKSFKSNVTTIRPVGAKFFHADGWAGGQTDRQMVG